MRFILTVLFVCFAQNAFADFEALIAAIKKNDLELVKKILDLPPCDVWPLINKIDENGRSPIFYVSSPEMLTFLLNRGARVYRNYWGDAPPVVDGQGMNVLHVLIAETAPRLFTEFPGDRENIQLRIEATGYFLMRLVRLNDRPHIQLETQQDNAEHVPGWYARGDGPFFDRLNNRYRVEYLPPPEGGTQAALRRKIRRELELQRELEREIAAERRAQEEATQRHEARMQAILDAELNTEDASINAIFDAAPVRDRLPLTVAMPTPLRATQERREILQGPQWWIDQSNSDCGLENSNN